MLTLPHYNHHPIALAILSTTDRVTLPPRRPAAPLPHHQKASKAPRGGKRGGSKRGGDIKVVADNPGARTGGSRADPHSSTAVRTYGSEFQMMRALVRAGLYHWVAVPGAGPDAAGDESGVTRRPKRQQQKSTTVSGFNPFEALGGRGSRSRSRKSYKAAKAQEDRTDPRRALSHGEAKKKAKKARRAARAAAEHGVVGVGDEALGGAMDAMLSDGRRHRPMENDLRSLRAVKNAGFQLRPREGKAERGHVGMKAGRA